METKAASSSSFPVSALVAITFLIFVSNNIHNSLAIATTKSSKTTYSKYLKTACNSAIYPKLCYNTLYPYTSTIQADDIKLCNAALTVTLKAASNTSAIVKLLLKQKGLSKREIAVVKDCQYEVGDSIDELKQSLKALNNLTGSAADREFQIDNMKTWISAAITDETTCTDGFEGIKVSSKVKSKIKKSILNFNRLTSNALALVNKLSYY